MTKCKHCGKEIALRWTYNHKAKYWTHLIDSVFTKEFCELTAEPEENVNAPKPGGEVDVGKMTK